MWLSNFDPFSKLGKVTFIPVLFQVTNSYKYKSKDIGFWTEDALVKYPFFLVNAHHHKHQFKEDTVNSLCSDSVIFADSGGLQTVVLKAPKPDIRELTKWQESHSNIGFSFDVIPFLTDIRKLTGWEFDRKNFVKCASETLENALTALSCRSNPNFKIYSIVQGRHYLEYVEWFEVLRKCNADGYCVKAPTNSPISVAESALFAYYHIDRPLHFLGMSNLSKTIVIYYFSQYFKHKITFDSSTYNVGNQFRTYIHPSIPSLKIRYVKTDGTVDIEEYDDTMIFEKVYDLSFCGCAACSFLTFEELKTWHETNDPRLGPLLSLHNFLSLKRMFTFVEQICHNKTALSQFVRSIFKASMARRVIAAFDMIDEGVKNGYDLVSEKYKSLLIENVEVARQKSLLDFGI